MAKTNQDATKKSSGPEEMSKEELVAAVKDLQEKNESADETIKDLQSKLNALTSPVANPRTFKSGDLEYEIVVGKLKWNGQVITAEDIIANDKLREEILAFAWEGRTEADFHKNGIFKIVF